MFPATRYRIPLLLSLVLEIGTGARSEASRPQRGAAQATQAPLSDDYVGDDTCLTCH